MLFPDTAMGTDQYYLYKRTNDISISPKDLSTFEGKKVDAIMCIVDLMKRDSEIKILIGCTEEEKQLVYQTHNETQYMNKECRTICLHQWVHAINI